jgi:hypothetical protein
MAMSSVRTIFLMVSGYQAPPLTLASSARMMTSRPATMPMPLMLPAPGTSPSYSMLAARVDSSRNGVPGSSSISMRSRTNILFWRASRSRSRCGRSSLARCWRALKSATMAALCAALARNSSP